MYPRQWLQDRELSNLFKKQSISHCREIAQIVGGGGVSEPQQTALLIPPSTHLLYHSSSLTSLLWAAYTKKRKAGM